MLRQHRIREIGCSLERMYSMYRLESTYIDCIIIWTGHVSKIRMTKLVPKV